MDERRAKINIGKAGGTASQNAKAYKINLPSSWVLEMGISEKSREVDISFDGEKITIIPLMSVDMFIQKKKAQGHKLKRYRFYDGDKLCASIYANMTDETLKIENHTDDIVTRAFGINKSPTWYNFAEFLEDRCVPRERASIREYIEAMGFVEYDPFKTVEKTRGGGKMAEDHKWFEIEVVA